MKFIITSALLTLAVAFQAYAKPMPAGVTPLVVFDPTIIQPNSASVWTAAGQEEVVVWDTSNAPASISNAGLVTLSGIGSAHPLASGFDLRAGQVIVTVPANVTKGTHTITLFGDSGNISQEFQIV